MPRPVMRGYQRDKMVEPLREVFFRGYKAPMVVSPCGSGKTTVFSEVAYGAQEKGNTVAILAHRTELIDQIDEAMQAVGVECDIIAAGYQRRHSPVMLASTQTLVRRLDKIKPPDLVIIDEAHHCIQGNTWGKIIDAWSSAKRIGFSASPIRTDGRGLAGFFDTLIIGPTVAELTPDYLAPARVFAPPTIDTSGLHTLAGDYIPSEVEGRVNKPSITGDAIAHYKRNADGKPALVFCVSVQHATDVAHEFRQAGYSFVMLKGGMDRQLRKQALADFKRGAIQGITAVDIFSEGLNCPGVHVGIFLRPTQSLGLWIQQTGRILRPCEGKEFAWIHDHAGNTQKFGLPTQDYQWSLTYDEAKRKRSSSINVRVCPKCWGASSSRASVCSNCGVPFDTRPRSQLIEVDGELVEIDAVLLKKRRDAMLKKAHTLEELLAVEKEMGYAQGWALRKFQTKKEAQRKHIDRWRATR